MDGESETLSVQVTELEMSGPPKTSFPVPVNIATALIRTHEIPLHYYRYLYRQVGHRWKWVERLRLTDEELAAVLHDPKTFITVLYVNGAPAGFFELNTRREDVVELEYFGLMEHGLGLGIGKWFLLQALLSAWQMNPAKVIVETSSADHPRALQLYQQMGFSPIATRQGEIRPLSAADIAALNERDFG